MPAAVWQAAQTVVAVGCCQAAAGWTSCSPWQSVQTTDMPDADAAGSKPPAHSGPGWAVVCGSWQRTQLSERLIPADVAVEVTRDYGETANEKANELLFHLGLATVSIIGLVLIAIGWRESIVVAIVIPVTILLTLFAAHAMGFTLNRVSLFALIFSIGILVDDAIVVIENIARHWAMPGGTRIEKAIAAVAEVGNPTIVATLTVVAACGGDPPPGKTYFERTIQPILVQSCAGNTSGCHRTSPDDPYQFAAGNLDVTSFEAIQKRRDVLEQGRFAVGE